LIAFVGGLALSTVVLVLSVRTSGLRMRGPDVVGVNTNPAGVSIVVMAVVAALLFIAATTAQLVVWVSTMVETAQRADKTWFVMLLAVGLLGLIGIANLLYLTVVPKLLGPGPRQRATTAPGVGADRHPLEQSLPHQ
jgi:hypothetical protein